MISSAINTVLTAVIGNYAISCFVLGLLIAGIGVLRLRGSRTGLAVSGLFVKNFIFYGIGVAMAVNSIMHSVFGDYAAKTIGWAQSPFQLELAFASLGIAVAAFFLYRPDTALRAQLAIVLVMVIFGLGDAFGHVYQTAVNHDHAVNNTGLLLFGDIVINLVGLGFVIWRAVAGRSIRPRKTAATDRYSDIAAAGSTETPQFRAG